MDAQHIAISKLVSLEHVRESFHCICSICGLKLGTRISQVEVVGPSGPQIVSIITWLNKPFVLCFNNALLRLMALPFFMDNWVMMLIHMVVALL